ncbi:LOB domain-containing protein 4-like [Zingiber officinale]|uniref:LOB domain-containing protein 4-like n=1 Tax=Zingiber officinale TaxID=94328 RepID=UPI001C4C37E1|nr:LOB domain-containing protein 4-like [Zingiber officinale]
MGQQKTQTAGCAACNHMHHRCLPNCIFAPYFPGTSPSFGYISQVYSCNNIKKILESAPVKKRRRKAESLAFEAEARIRNPEFTYQPPLEQQYWHQMPQLTTMTAQSYHEQPDDFPTQPDFQTQSYHKQPDDFRIPHTTQSMSEMCQLQQHDQLAEIEDFLNETRSDDLMTDAAVQAYEADLKDLDQSDPFDTR